MDVCQPRNLTEHIPNIILKKAWASPVTGNMVSSAHTASTIGSLTHKWFIKWKKVQQVMKGKEDR